jgi:hypothetical protein
MSSDELALLWVRLGSFRLWGALRGEKLGLLWVRLGSFGFVLALGGPDGPEIGFALGSFGFVLGSFLGGRKGEYCHNLFLRRELR